MSALNDESGAIAGGALAVDYWDMGKLIRTRGMPEPTAPAK
jgi:hypothetical protein